MTTDDSLLPRMDCDYRLDPLDFAKRVVRHLKLWVGGQLGPQGSLLLMPELVPGASVALR